MSRRIVADMLEEPEKFGDYRSARVKVKGGIRGSRVVIVIGSMRVV